jgi:hypothetical protein
MRSSQNPQKPNFVERAFSEVRFVLSPNNWPHGLQKVAVWHTRLLHTQAYTFSYGSIRKKKRMIKISIEVKSGATSFKVAVQAESIVGALEIVKRYNAGKECEVVFPIDPEGFFVKDDPGSGGMVGKIAA